MTNLLQTRFVSLPEKFGLAPIAPAYLHLELFEEGCTESASDFNWLSFVRGVRAGELRS
jgi:hypothetical protein